MNNVVVLVFKLRLGLSNKKHYSQFVQNFWPRGSLSFQVFGPMPGKPVQ